MNTRLLVTMHVSVGTPLNIGAVPHGTRRTAPLRGGTFDGPRLRGTVLPGGSVDWQLLRSDGVLEMDLRLTLQTDDGALISMRSFALRHGPPEVVALKDPSTQFTRCCDMSLLMNSCPLMVLRLATSATEEIGSTSQGTLTIVPVIGGSFEGERLRGKVLGGGGDWVTARQDGTFTLDLRITVELHNRKLSWVSNGHFRPGPDGTGVRAGAEVWRAGDGRERCREAREAV